MSGNNGAGNSYPNQHHNIVRSNIQRTPRQNIHQMYPHQQLPVSAPPQYYNQIVPRGQQPSQLYTSAQHNMHYPQNQMGPAPIYYYPPVVMHQTRDPAALSNPYLRGQGLINTDSIQQQMSMPPPNMIVSNQGQTPAAIPAAVGTNRLPAPKKQRPHALQIINPITRLNVLDEINKSKSEAPAPGASKTDIVKASKPLGSAINNFQPTAVNSNNKAEIQGAAFMNKMQEYNISVVPDICPSSDNMEHTPIVSASSDGPSVEIHTEPSPAILKAKNKSIEIVAPTDLVNCLQTTTSDIINSEMENLPISVENTDIGTAFEQPQLEQNDIQISPSLPLAVVNTASEQELKTVVNEIININNDQLEATAAEETIIQDNINKKSADYTKASDSNETPIDINQSILVAPNDNENMKSQEVQKDNSQAVTPKESLNSPPEEDLCKPVIHKSETVQKAPGKGRKMKKKGPVSSLADKSVKAESQPIEKQIQDNVKKTGKVPETTSIQAKPEEVEKICMLDETENKDGNQVKSSDNAMLKSCDETDKAASHRSDIDISNNDTDTNTNKLVTDANKEKTESGNEESSNVENAISIEKSNEDEIPIVLTPSSIAACDETKDNIAEEKMAPLITYNEGQWSPSTPSGQKSYDKDQLLILRGAATSQVKPELKITLKFLMKTAQTSQSSLMPPFMRQGKRNQSWDSVGAAGSLGRHQFSKHSSMYGSAKGGVSNQKSNEPEMIHVSLSLKGEVKLNETENAWRPSRLQEDTRNVPPEVLSNEQMLRKVRGMLNKLTPDNFNSLVEQIMSLKIDTPERVTGVMILVFEKAIDEPNFSTSYALLCQRLGDNKIQSEVKSKNSSNKSDSLQFKTALLNKTQHEFGDNVLECKAKVEKLKPIIEKIKVSTDADEKAELKASLDYEERKIRRRSGGTVRFIGELFKISMLTSDIINFCIVKLLDQTCEDKLECLCKLLTTVGQQFEQSVSKTGTKHNLDMIVKKMQSIVDKKADSKISSRIRFMLQDVIDLRKNKWASKITDLKPKTMDQIQRETEREQINNHILNTSYKKDDRRFNSGGSNANNNTGGASGNRDFHNKNNRQQSWNSGDSGFSRPSKGDDNWCTPSSKSNRVLDANKLTSTPDYDQAKPVLGSSSQFQWVRTKDNSKPSATSSNSFSALSVLDTKNVNTERGGGGENRNKGSFNKRSMEMDRDRYGGRHSRNGSGRSRENSSSRNISNYSNNQSRTGTNSQSNQRSNRPPISDPKPLSSSASMSSIEISNLSSSSSSSLTKLNFAEISDDDVETLKKAVIKMVSPLSDVEPEDSISLIQTYPKNYRWAIIYTIISDYLHLHQTKQSHREQVAETVIMFCNKKLITSEDIRYAYKQFSDIIDDILIDVPGAWKYVLEFTGPLLYNKIIHLKDVWTRKPITGKDDSGKKFVKQLINYHCQEYGPIYTYELWKTSDFKWTTFMPNESVQEFIQDNNFDFVESKDIPPKLSEHVSDMSRICNRIKYLLTNNASTDVIMDYISGNIQNIDKEFIRGLTTTIMNHAVKFVNNNYKLDKKELRKVGISLLQRYMDSRENRELECLYAIQELVIKLEHPAGLLQDIYLELYECYVIPSESFIKWRDSKHEPSGKGVAVKSLTSFFSSLNNASDESN